MGRTVSKGRPMALAVAQIAPRPDSLADSVAAHLRMAEAAADRLARLVVFPELSLTAYRLTLTRADALDGARPELRALARMARRRGIVVVVGAPIACGDGLAIGSLAFLPEGPVVAYTKQHLGGQEDTAFVAGCGGPLLAIEDLTIGLAICAEVNHPAHCERTVARGASVYAASSFVTPEDYAKDSGHLRAYARKHGIVTLMANFGGPCGGLESAGRSALWDPTGQQIAIAPPTGEAVIVAERRSDRWAPAS